MNFVSQNCLRLSFKARTPAVALLTLIFAAVFSFQSLFGESSSTDLRQIDAAFTRERTRTAHTDFQLKLRGLWKASFDGKTVDWTWGSKGWSCPKDPIVDCKQWVPVVFGWWSTPKTWLESNRPVEKIGYEIESLPLTSADQSKDSNAENEEQSSVLAGEPQSPSPSPAAVTEQPRLKLAQRETPRRAHEVWEWKDAQESSYKMYLSALNQLIDKLEIANETESFEWAARKGKRTELKKITIEKDGKRVTLSRP